MNLDGMVPSRTLDFAAAVQDFLQDMQENPHKLDRGPYHFLEQVGDFGVVRREGANLYTVQLLTEGGANYFLQAADQYSHWFGENLEEDAAYQIPEIILAHHEELSSQDILAKMVAREVLWPIFNLIYGNPPNHFSSVQLARYGAPNNVGTGWHSDRDSEATCTVSLAPERHRGGGTLLMPHGAFMPVKYLPPLRKGEALLFNGRTTLHRGLEVKEGERNLLVYWMTNKD